ncbi:MAG: hypothetical protein IT521_16815 [Burkholderiales bacterium]|nr:hypothetical protein [Burkholderiales bacterium]
MLIVTGCATSPISVPAAAPKTPEAQQALVAQRASERWDAMVKNDLDAAYAFMSPGSRQVTSLEKFKANTRRGAFRKGIVDSVVCEEGACKVRVVVTYDHPKMKGITTPVSEAWIIDGGQAWYVYASP